MTNSTGVRLAAVDRRSFPRKSLSQNLIGGAALACIVLGFGWTLTANVLGTGADPAAVSASVESVVGSGSAVTFSARFEALGAGAEGLSVVRKSPPAVRQASD